ncbi:hypothetical protein [Streptomyces thermolilacinus]|nr:hypothetical protein [Streptomyces thermolilacinus]
MGGRNRLLNFRHSRTATLELTAPRAVELLAGLRKGWGFAEVVEVEGTHGTGELPGGHDRHGLVTQKTTQAGLDGSL